MEITAIVLSLLALLWRLYRSAWRHAKTEWGHAWMNWVDGLNRLYCLRYHRLKGDTIQLPHHPSRRLKGGAVRLALTGGSDIYPVRIDGIAAEGVVIGALFKRSHATQRTLPVIETEGKSVHQLMGILESLLNNP